ncbi:MAG: hypothetical protein F4Y86_16145 [Gammaproteobacteria bacterium]|nr:hypothetical protein [Gammaproteobacteria bacterium]
MTVLVLVLLALVLGGLLAALMARDPGYVLLAWDGMTVETSLWLALLAVALGTFVASRTVRFVRALIGSGEGLRRWLHARQQDAAGRRFNQGLLLLAEGRWNDARSAFLGSAGTGARALPGLLHAARAAHQLGKGEERDALLDRATEAVPAAAVAAGLERASMQQAEGEWERSLETLTELAGKAPRHPLALTLTFRARLALDDTDGAEELLKDVAQAGIASAEEVARAREQICLARLARIQTADAAAEHARALWKRTPAAARAQEKLLLAYVDALLAGGDAAAAEHALRTGLERRFLDSWALRYGTIHADPERQIKTATAWLETHPDSVALLQALGRLHLAAAQRDAGVAYLIRAAEAMG